MDILGKVRNKYPWLNAEELAELVDTAIGWFYLCRYPCEPNANKTTHPIESFVDVRCVIMLCDEISQRNGFNTALGYKENGIQFTFDSAWISDALRNAIVPYAGVI